ncbi:MAG: 50S ribosomal protein L3 [Proteobacteria bacterium]|nr:50S ribosomal protein L3 [Pseudomonadota bacterium]
MTVGILGRKIGMTQLIADNGEVIPVTVVEAGPCQVIQRKTVGKDGYSAIQLGAFEKKINLSNKPEKGHFNKAKVHPARFVKELKVEDSNEYELGQTITADVFQAGDFIDVTGVSKGKGTAGVMKRWGFAGAPASHGAEKIHRKPGSIGNSADPARVFKGKKLPGRMGSERVTIQSLSVVQVRAEDNLILVKGAVPGHSNGLLILKKAVKKG